jgi:hypothetical protein
LDHQGLQWCFSSFESCKKPYPQEADVLGTELLQQRAELFRPDD